MGERCLSVLQGRVGCKWTDSEALLGLRGGSQAPRTGVQRRVILSDQGPPPLAPGAPRRAHHCFLLNGSLSSAEAACDHAELRQAWKAARHHVGLDASRHMGAVKRSRGQKAQRREDAKGKRKQPDSEGDSPSLAEAPPPGRSGTQPVQAGGTLACAVRAAACLSASDTSAA